MPRNVTLSEEHKENILKGHGLCKDTKDRRIKVFSHFSEYITGNFDLKQALEDKSVTREDIYQYYKDYILSYRVQKDVKKIEEQPTEENLELPRFKTIEVVKSHLKMSCINELKLDLTDRLEFPDEAGFWKDYLKHLKENRKMKIDHYKSVSPDVLDGAYKLFADANAAYNARGAIDYKDYLEKLPADWRDKYHYILQWCPMWFATLLEINRGREGIQDLLITDFQKFEDPHLELKFWIKVEQGVTKADQRSLDGEVDDRGFLPYWVFYPGCNPGQMFEEHLTRLPPDCKFLFNKPKQLGAKLHDPGVTVLFENNKVGKHTINGMVSTMCKITNATERFTNHDLRATGLTALKKADFDFDEIKKVSGHKSTKSIEENYHVSLETKKKADMMFCVLNASKLGRGADFDPISKHLKRKNVNTIDLSLPANKVACSLPNENASSSASKKGKTGDNETSDIDSSSPELDDSFKDADWDAKANFDLHYESSEDDIVESPKKKRSRVVFSLPSTVPRSNCTSAKLSSSPPTPSQPLLKPVSENDVRAALRSMKIEKICLSHIKASQPGLVPLPTDMITTEVESADLLLIKCLHPDEEDSSYSPLYGTDGDVPIPTLKWTLAKSKNIQVINGKILIDWCKERKVPDFHSIKYQTAGECTETKRVTKPDPNPEKLFSGWWFFIHNFQEPDFTQADLERIVLNTGGKLVSHGKAKSFPKKVTILGDGYLDVANKVLCPSYVVQCVQQGRILCEEDYIYVTSKSDPELSSPKIKTKPAVERPVFPNTNGDLKPQEPPGKKIDQTCLAQAQVPNFGHFPPTPSPYFSPPPFNYNFPQNAPFFQFPVQQFPFPFNYPIAGQANLLSGAAYPKPGTAYLHPTVHAQSVQDHQPAVDYFQQGVHFQQDGAHLQPFGSSFQPSSANIVQAATVPQLPIASSLQPASVGSNSHFPTISLAVADPKPPQQTEGDSPRQEEVCTQSTAQSPSGSDNQVWMKILSRKHGTYYYYNKITHVNQWEAPTEKKI